jgi:hypothetical protein
LLEVIAPSEAGAMEQILADAQVRIKLDKLLARVGLADSISDAVRKLKQKAVAINGEVKTDPVVFWDVREESILRAGKKMKKVRITASNART